MRLWWHNLNNTRVWSCFLKSCFFGQLMRSYFFHSVRVKSRVVGIFKNSMQIKGWYYESVMRKYRWNEQMNEKTCILLFSSLVVNYFLIYQSEDFNDSRGEMYNSFDWFPHSMSWGALPWDPGVDVTGVTAHLGWVMFIILYLKGSVTVATYLSNLPVEWSFWSHLGRDLDTITLYQWEYIWACIEVTT